MPATCRWWTRNRENWIVYNGEVYNYRDLPETLGLTGFTSRTDTEVVLKAYAKLGPRCLDHLNGIFAFAIWDARRKELFCARDRLGVKPFFFAWDGESLLLRFGSESLVRGGDSEDARTLAYFTTISRMAFMNTARKTFFDGINQLAPGHTLTIGHDGNKIECYWMIDPGREAHPELEFSTQGGFDQACADYADLAQDAIRLQLHADTPVSHSYQRRTRFDLSHGDREQNQRRDRVHSRLSPKSMVTKSTMRNPMSTPLRDRSGGMWRLSTSTFPRSPNWLKKPCGTMKCLFPALLLCANKI